MRIEQRSSGITCLCQMNTILRCSKSIQARGDLYAITEGLAVLRFGSRCSRNELARPTLLAMLTGAALVLGGAEVLSRWDGLARGERMIA